jgi:hypothetical protein
MLLSYDGVGEVLLDYLENRITINTDCNSSVSLIDTDINISLKISYDIDCQSCGPAITPTPTPTYTPTITPTPTGTNGTIIPVTSTPTPTNTVTPTKTPTPTPTPTPTGTVPVVQCLGYKIQAFNATADGVTFSFNGCCGNNGDTSIHRMVADPEITICSTTEPTVPVGGSVGSPEVCPTC